MPVKIENNSGRNLPKKTEENVNSIFESLPREHLRGIDRVRFVETINDPRIRSVRGLTQIPGLYHPRQGSQPAWLEVALGVLLPKGGPLHKRLLPRLSMKANLATIIFSLVGQHHYMTLRHSVKKGQLEVSIRDYTEKNLKRWNEREHGLRTRLFKPLQPTLERWARALNRQAKKGRNRSTK